MQTKPSHTCTNTSIPTTLTSLSPNDDTIDNFNTPGSLCKAHAPSLHAQQTNPSRNCMLEATLWSQVSQYHYSEDIARARKGYYYDIWYWSYSSL